MNHLVRIDRQENLPDVSVYLLLSEMPLEVVDDDVLVDVLEAGEVVLEDQLALLLTLHLQSKRKKIWS